MKTHSFYALMINIIAKLASKAVITKLYWVYTCLTKEYFLSDFENVIKAV